MTLRHPSSPGRLRPTALAAGLLAACSLLTWPATAQNTAAPAETPAVRGKAPVTLNFVNADIEAVSRAMGAMLDRQLIVDPRVKGNITLYSEQPLSIREAYLNYLAALRGLGFAVVDVGGLLKVVPEPDAKLQTGTVSIGGVARTGDQIITQIFRLQHENPNNLVAVLRPLISPNNTINANPGNNTLVITDYADNLQRIAKIVSALDAPTNTDIEVIPLMHAVAADLAPVLQRLVESAAVAVPGGAPTGGGTVAIMTDVRTNSLIVRSGNIARMSLVKTLVEKLDRPTQIGGPAGNIYVVHLKNQDAVKLAQVLRAAFTVNSAGGGGGGLGGGTSSFGGGGTSPTSSTTLSAAQQNANSSTTGGMSSAAAAPVSASASPSTGGAIQADPSTNSLIITAAEPLYRQMRAMIDQLDTRRAQVYIESMIVELTGGNAAEAGLQWQGILGKEGDKYGLAGGTNFGGTGNLLTITQAQAGLGGTSSTGTSGSAAAGAGNLLGQGLNIGLIKDFGSAYGLAAIARLLQSQTSTNIVSTPNLITLDNEEAKIIVGSNVPFITGQYTNTGTATTSPFQTIERQDVGVTLRIKPQVGEGGVVRMTIFQESSALTGDVAPGTSNAGPTTRKRSIESTVSVDDGQILVLGGLIEDSYENTTAKVPLLGDIPYLGALFRNESRTRRRTNLMVFLRPIVMRDGASSNQLSLDRYDMIRAQQQGAQPVPNLLIPINESPVLPPATRVERLVEPLVPPPSNPASTPRTPTPPPLGTAPTPAMPQPMPPQPTLPPAPPPLAPAPDPAPAPVR